jgi:hypothetical protein
VIPIVEIDTSHGVLPSKYPSTSVHQFKNINIFLENVVGQFSSNFLQFSSIFFKGKIPNIVGILWLLYNVLLDDIHCNTIMEV